jgi:hypothetical protein
MPDAKNTTIAQQIATLAGNDGQEWTTIDGREFEEVLEEAATAIDHRDGRRVHGGAVRYTFADDSVIVVLSGTCWDLGLSTECYCCAGVGHDEDCSEGPSRGRVTPVVRRRIEQHFGGDECIDLDGCATVGDILRAAEAQDGGPELLDSIIIGGGSHDPTMRDYLLNLGRDTVVWKA